MDLKRGKYLIYKSVLYGSLIYFIYLLLLITLQYIPINYDVAFLRIKQEEIQLTYYKWAFFSHVFSSIIVIILGLTQFSKTVRNKATFIHKLSGKIYVFLILAIASPSGLIMSYHANGGVVAQISFSILSVLWFIFTLKAYSFIKKGDVIRHKNFMIRSYALTLSAISLRLLKYGIVTVYELPPMDTYKIVAVLGWTLNLGISELIILSKKRNEISFASFIE